MILATLLAAAAIALPPTDARFDYQLGGPYPPAGGVGIVARDRTAPPAPGAYGVCYVNAFQAETAARGWWRRAHPRLLLRTRTGRLVVDRDWDEPLLDTRRPDELLRAVGPWIDRCAADGYRAVEFDNLDSWTRSGGRLSRANAVAYARRLTARAHAVGLAAGQKNAAELARRGRTIGFDFAVAEECQVYDECGAYARAYDDHVLEIEYADRPFAAACADHGARWPVLRRDRDLVPSGAPGHVARRCR